MLFYSIIFAPCSPPLLSLAISFLPSKKVIPQVRYSKAATQIPNFEVVFPSPHFKVTPRFLNAKASFILAV